MTELDSVIQSLHVVTAARHPKQEKKWISVHVFFKASTNFCLKEQKNIL